MFSSVWMPNFVVILVMNSKVYQTFLHSPNCEVNISVCRKQ